MRAEEAAAGKKPYGTRVEEASAGEKPYGIRAVLRTAMSSALPTTDSATEGGGGGADGAARRALALSAS